MHFNEESNYKICKLFTHNILFHSCDRAVLNIPKIVQNWLFSVNFVIGIQDLSEKPGVRYVGGLGVFYINYYFLLEESLASFNFVYSSNDSFEVVFLEKLHNEREANKSENGL